MHELLTIDRTLLTRDHIRDHTYYTCIVHDLCFNIHVGVCSIATSGPRMKCVSTGKMLH